MTNLLVAKSSAWVRWMEGLSGGFFTLEYAKAADVFNQLESLLADQAANSLDGLFVFTLMESPGSVLVASPK